MAVISVKHDLDKLKKTLNRWEKKQIPFATSQALNDLAFSIRKDTVKVLWPRSVQVKQRGFANAAFRVEKATKRHLTAAVFDRLNLAIFPRQIKGEVRIPYSSTHMAVPTWWAKTPTGRIKRAARLGSSKLFKMQRNGSSKPGLWMRTRQGLRLMYTLEKRIKVPKAFPFFELGKRTATVHWSRFMDKRLKAALKTAR